MQNPTIPMELAELVQWFIDEVATLQSANGWSVIINGNQGTVQTETRTVQQGRDEQGRRVRKESRIYREFRVKPS